MKLIKSVSGIGAGATTLVDDARAETSTSRTQHGPSIATGAVATVATAGAQFMTTVAAGLVALDPAPAAGSADSPQKAGDVASLNPGEVSTLAVPTDDLFSQQFYLRSTASGDLDLGLFRGSTSVWDEYTGAGVHVGIIDDGIDYNHSDLDGNYDHSLETVDGFHTDPRNKHGTSVSGIIASERNGSGTVGIAYDSHITMMAAIGYSPSITITDAFINAKNFDVVNNSWGYTTPMYDEYFNSALTAQYAALDDVTLSGRGGLGTIFVKSAGNGRDDVPTDNSNFSFINSHWGTIAVAAVNRDGTVSSYSTGGASVLVSAFGTGIPGEIVTTDRAGADGYTAGDYTSTFNGTSAAGPMVAGIAALMIDANPNLGYRDVQEILAMTARHVGGAIGGSIVDYEHYNWRWNAGTQWNGGGQHFSEDYGFGLVDALAAVRLAETWSDQNTRSNRTVSGVAYSGSALAINDNSQIDVPFVLGPGVRVEHAVFDLGISHTYVGDLTVWLTSPSGTISYLLNRNGGSNDFPDNGPNDISLSSNMFRGEDSGGTWTLSIRDDINGDTGTLSAAYFYVDGSTSNNDTYVLTEEYSDYQTSARQSIGDTDGGIDTLNAAAVFTASTIRLSGGTSTVDGVNFTVTGGIENAVGGDGGDVITGNSDANSLRGMRGNDTMDGSSGSDTADYFDKTQSVAVVLNGAALVTVSVNGIAEDSIQNVENLIGGSAGDSLTGDGLANSFRGGVGNDTMDGLGGSDTADYSDKTQNVAVALNGAAVITVSVNSIAEDSIQNFENLIGGSAGDSLAGDGLANSFRGGLGNDTMDGLGGSDTADYSDKTQSVAVALNGAAVVTVSVNGIAEDSIQNFENLIGGSAGDSLTGDGLDNSFRGGLGNDTMDGSSGIDTADYSDKTTKVTVALNASGNGSGIVTGADTDTLLGIENLSGGSAGDVFTGNSAANTFTGNAGNDVFRGMTGNDSIDGGVGVHDIVTYSEKSQQIRVSLSGGTYATVFVNGVAENSIKNVEDVQGGLVGDILTGDSLANTFTGLDGNDVFRGMTGNDSIDGGVGVHDIVTYSEKSQQIRVSLNGGTYATVFVNGVAEDSIKNVEDVQGGLVGDILTGDSLANTFTGLDGNDVFRGMTGNDSIDGGVGVHDIVTYSEKSQQIRVSLNGGTYATVFVNGVAEDSIKNVEDVQGGLVGDILTGDSLANTFTGLDGNDVFRGMIGNDSIDGGAGVHDIVTYSEKSQQIRVSLNGGTYATVFVNGVAEDSIKNVEDVQGGLVGDILTGDSLANTFTGLDGNDTLAGGLGNDTLTGGLNADVFLFNAAPSAANIDTVIDFKHAEGDKIHLDNAVMAGLGVATGALGTQFYAAAGASNGDDADAHIVYNSTTGALYYDSNANGGGGMTQIAIIAGHPALVTGDFMIV